MKIAFLYPNLPGVNTLPPAIGYFTAILRQDGHELSLFNTTSYEILFDSENVYKDKSENLNARPYDTSFHEKGKRQGDVRADFLQFVEEFSPDLIAVSCTEDMYHIAVQVLSVLPDNRPLVVMGGVFPTFAPQKAIRGSGGKVDYVLVGEGEDTLRLFCRLHEQGKDLLSIPGLCCRREDGTFLLNPPPTPVELATIPLPDYSLFDDTMFSRPMQGAIWRMIPITTVRGCPFVCTYCNAPAQQRLYKAHGCGFYRKQRIEQVYAEIRQAVDEYGADSLYFGAETFISNDRDLDEFCEMYEEFSLPFWMQTRIETITERRYRRLKDVGLLRTGFGLEHGNEDFRNEHLHRKISNKEIVENLAIVSDLDIPFSVNNMIGFPFETRELAFETIELNRKISADGMNAYTFVPFHGTEMRAVCLQHGYIEEDVIVRSVMRRSPLTMPQFSADEIEGIRRCFVLYVKMPKERWPQIRQAEALTEKGDALYQQLLAECAQSYF